MNHLKQLEKMEENPFSKEELAQVNLQAVPDHIAIIMDGNRRWAQQKNKPIAFGHWKGAERLDEIVRAAVQLGTRVLTVYAFSTENWARSPEEIDTLLEIFKTYLMIKKETLVKEGIRLETIGDLSKFPQDVLSAFTETKKATSQCDRIDLILAVNYGGRDEICRAISRVVERVEMGQIDREQINEDLISRLLDTARWPDPDLLIRTSGEFRISNFLIWQISYSEIYCVDALWPDFCKRHLLDAVIHFQQRNRRFGE